MRVLDLTGGQPKSTHVALGLGVCKLGLVCLGFRFGFAQYNCGHRSGLA